MSKLLLFDLDGTMLSTQGTGMRAMRRAGQKVFGDRFKFDNIHTAGGLDPLLFRAAAVQAGIEPSEANHVAFREAYCRTLPQELASPEAGIVVHPNVKPLLLQLHEHPGVTLGILTGNYGYTARVKLLAAGIDPVIFAVTSFGDEGPDRPSLVKVAVARYEKLHGRVPHWDHVLVIGDTPKDIDAAHANGCRCLAVATGPYTVEQLRAAKGDYVMKDLSDASVLWEWIGR
jgi:phosphoglycolate phosphatase